MATRAEMHTEIAYNRTDIRAWEPQYKKTLRNFTFYVSYNKLVRSPYQTCAEMLPLLRTHTEQLNWPSKRKISKVKAVRQRMRGAPEPGAPAPATGHSPRILFPTAFPIDFLRFEVHFSCSVWVLRRDSISAHVWYGLRINLAWSRKDICWY